MPLRRAFAPLILSLVVLAGAARAAESRPFRITGLCHIGMWVRDVEQSRAFYKDYLGFEEPYTLTRPSGELFVVFIKVNDRQTINLYPNAAKILPNGENLYHVGLETDNAAAFHDHLAAHGVTSGAVHKTAMGDIIFLTKDPDGIGYEITEYQPGGRMMQSAGKFLAATRPGEQIVSTTLVVADLARSRRFYCELLGCAEVESGEKGVIRLQLPHGPGAILLTQREAPAGAPALRSQERFTLSSRDPIRVATDLNSPARRGDRPLVARPNGRLDCIDPDGTCVTITPAEGLSPVRKDPTHD